MQFPHRGRCRKTIRRKPDTLRMVAPDFLLHKFHQNKNNDIMFNRTEISPMPIKVAYLISFSFALLAKLII